MQMQTMTVSFVALNYIFTTVVSFITTESFLCLLLHVISLLPLLIVKMLLAGEHHQSAVNMNFQRYMNFFNSILIIKMLHIF